MPVIERLMRLPTVLAVLVMSTAVSAATAGPARCVAIADRAERLACYDQAHGRDAAEAAVPAPAAEAPDAAPAAEPPEPPAAAEPAPAADPSGLGGEQLPESRQPAADSQDELIATVASLGEQATGRHWFRLDNGQLWIQVSPARSAVRAGDSVRISRGILGTYTLRRADGGSRSTSVRRLE